MAVATGMHIAIFHKFTVWTTRAVSGEVGCSLRFAKMPGDCWVELTDFVEGDAVMPAAAASAASATVVKQEVVHSTLADDLMRAYVEAFPPCDDSSSPELEMKEVVVDRRLLSQPVVVMERLGDQNEVVVPKDVDVAAEAVVRASDENAQMVPLVSEKQPDPPAVEVHVKGRGRNTAWRARRTASSVVTRSQDRKKVISKDERSAVCASNIVSGSRRPKIVTRTRSVSKSSCVDEVVRKRFSKRRKCTYCSFETRECCVLRQHLRAQHCLFVCSFASCTSNWVSKGACKAHEELHRTASFRCDECGWYTSAKAELDRHVLKHTTDKPWVCDAKGCGRAFKCKGDWTSHKITHGRSTQVFSCSKCEYTAKNKCYVTYHMRKHEKPRIKCPSCPAVFRYYEDKKRHVEKGCAE